MTSLVHQTVLDRLDQLGPRPFCGEFCMWKLEGTTWTVKRSLCGQWGCATCGRRRYAWFTRNLTLEVLCRRLQFFWTLTLSTESISAEQSYGAVTSAWSRFRALLAWSGYRLEYVWVIEQTRAGYAHMHIFWDLYLTHAYVSATWRKASRGSYVVWVERLVSAGAVEYVAKYCVKNAVEVREGRSWTTRRYHLFGKSQGVWFEPFRGGGTSGWKFSRVPYTSVERKVEALWPKDLVAVAGPGELRGECLYMDRGGGTDVVTPVVIVESEGK